MNGKIPHATASRPAAIMMTRAPRIRKYPRPYCFLLRESVTIMPESRIKSGAAREESTRIANGTGGRRRYGTVFAPIISAIAIPRRRSTGISRNFVRDADGSAVTLSILPG